MGIPFVPPVTPVSNNKRALAPVCLVSLRLLGDGEYSEGRHKWYQNVKVNGYNSPYLDRYNSL